MKRAAFAISIVAISGCASSGLTTAPSHLSQPGAPPFSRVLFIADNQEHNMLGGLTKSQGTMSEKLLASVAMRSPLANVGGRQLMKSAIRFGMSEGASTVIHVGDLSDVSCPSEIRNALDAMDDADPGKNWFTTLGNHDGFLAGNITMYDAGPIDETLYQSAPDQGIDDVVKSWRNACRLPSMGADAQSASILTKRDAIEAYVQRLQQRPSAHTDTLSTETLPFRGGTSVPCHLLSLKIPDQHYAAAVRLCPAARVADGEGFQQGPWASYIVQSLDVGDTRFLLLDTSQYWYPKVTALIRTGELNESQREAATPFLAGRNRQNVIIVGHHPLGELMDTMDNGWILRNSDRYISAHTHAATSVYQHSRDSLSTRELNIGSLIDFPSQAVLAELAPNSAMSFRTAGKNTAGNQWSGYALPCVDNESTWKIRNDSIYTSYVIDHYPTHLITALRAASNLAPPSARIDIPSGREAGDWLRLEQTLNAVNRLTGSDATFWACQAWYASDATRRERALGEKIMAKFGSKPGTITPGNWFVF